MGAVDGDKILFILMDALIIGELYQAAASVAAHAAFAAVGVIIFHFKIETRVRVEQHESIGSDAEAPVTKQPDPFFGQGRITPVPVIQNDKIVAGSLIFKKVKGVHMIRGKSSAIYGA
jgi:hypothetical protein